VESESASDALASSGASSGGGQGAVSRPIGPVSPETGKKFQRLNVIAGPATGGTAASRVLLTRTCREMDKMFGPVAREVINNQDAQQSRETLGIKERDNT
jgi:hypothetical protein